jgi:hypothetical protein
VPQHLEQLPAYEAPPDIEEDAEEGHSASVTSPLAPETVEPTPSPLQPTVNLVPLIPDDAPPAYANPPSHRPVENEQKVV